MATIAPLAEERATADVMAGRTRTNGFSAGSQDGHHPNRHAARRAASSTVPVGSNTLWPPPELGEGSAGWLAVYRWI
jgi:hypothetical protein